LCPTFGPPRPGEVARIRAVRTDSKTCRNTGAFGRAPGYPSQEDFNEYGNAWRSCQLTDTAATCRCRNCVWLSRVGDRVGTADCLTAARTQRLALRSRVSAEDAAVAGGRLSRQSEADCTLDAVTQSDQESAAARWFSRSQPARYCGHVWQRENEKRLKDPADLLSSLRGVYI
jgi:hypothetical protein